MQKYTHVIFAILLFLLFNFIFRFPLYVSIFAFIGAMIPDIDLKPKKYHRKLLHNVWVLILILFAGFSLSLIDRMFAIAFSIGFLSHLIIDGITPMGIMPFWPIKKPRIRGPIKTGGWGEFAVMIFLLFIIFLIARYF